MGLRGVGSEMRSVLLSRASVMSVSSAHLCQRVKRVVEAFAGHLWRSGNHKPPPQLQRRLLTGELWPDSHLPVASLSVTPDVPRDVICCSPLKGHHAAPTSALLKPFPDLSAGISVQAIAGEDPMLMEAAA